jgi:hypothetical protein
MQWAGYVLWTDRKQISKIAFVYTPKSRRMWDVQVWPYDLGTVLAGTDRHGENSGNTLHKDRVLIGTVHSICAHMFRFTVEQWDRAISSSGDVQCLCYFAYRYVLNTLNAELNPICHGVTNTRCCIQSCMRSWWWVEVSPETCRAVSRYK